MLDNRPSGSPAVGAPNIIAFSFDGCCEEAGGRGMGISPRPAPRPAVLLLLLLLLLLMLLLMLLRPGLFTALSSFLPT